MAQQTSFQTILDSLIDTQKDFPSRYLSYFSDIDPASLKLLLETWPRVKPTRKLVLLEKLLSLLDSDTLVSFDDLGRALLTDADPGVRARAIRLLAECDDPKLVPTFIKILKDDSELEPRLEAATLLGEFVMLGELEELPEKLHHDAEDILLAIESGDNPPSLRRRALESLGFSERPEVTTVIESAFNREDPEWAASALLAMGRSSDDRWEDEVVGMLLNEDPRVRLAAVEAAGELRLASARAILLKMFEDEDDDAVASAIIWSLSQVGGEDVRIYLLNLLDQAEDDELTAYLEEALENLEFTEGLEQFDLLALDSDDDLLDDDEE
ncbi:MAG: HEAT repeat domain-containing protein [Chloroflexi bacterium]|nr:HEAT repeat domain-containing protein [Chloroflexota bacterium]